MDDLFLHTESLIVFDNQSKGSIPSEIGNLVLRELQGHRNQFTGNLPDELFRNANLLVLRLDNNEITGSLSNRIGNLQGLVELRLGNNTMTGNIPFMLFGLNQMRTYCT